MQLMYFYHILLSATLFMLVGVHPPTHSTSHEIPCPTPSFFAQNNVNEVPQKIVYPLTTDKNGHYTIKMPPSHKNTIQWIFCDKGTQVGEAYQTPASLSFYFPDKQHVSIDTHFPISHFSLRAPTSHIEYKGKIYLDTAAIQADVFENRGKFTCAKHSHFDVDTLRNFNLLNVPSLKLNNVSLFENSGTFYAKTAFFKGNKWNAYGNSAITIDHALVVDAKLYADSGNTNSKLLTFIKATDRIIILNRFYGIYALFESDGTIFIGPNTRIEVEYSLCSVSKGHSCIKGIMCLVEPHTLIKVRGVGIPLLPQSLQDLIKKLPQGCFIRTSQYLVKSGKLIGHHGPVIIQAKKFDMTGEIHTPFFSRPISIATGESTRIRREGSIYSGNDLYLHNASLINQGTLSAVGNLIARSRQFIINRAAMKAQQTLSLTTNLFLNNGLVKSGNLLINALLSGNIGWLHGSHFEHNSLAHINAGLVQSDNLQTNSLLHGNFGLVLPSFDSLWNNLTSLNTYKTIAQNTAVSLLPLPLNAGIATFNGCSYIYHQTKKSCDHLANFFNRPPNQHVTADILPAIAAGHNIYNYASTKYQRIRYTPEAPPFIQAATQYGTQALQDIFSPRQHHTALATLNMGRMAAARLSHNTSLDHNQGIQLASWLSSHASTAQNRGIQIAHQIVSNNNDYSNEGKIYTHKLHNQTKSYTNAGRINAQKITVRADHDTTTTPASSVHSDTFSLATPICNHAGTLKIRGPIQASIGHLITQPESALTAQTVLLSSKKIDHHGTIAADKNTIQARDHLTTHRNSTFTGKTFAGSARHINAHGTFNFNDSFTSQSDTYQASSSNTTTAPSVTLAAHNIQLNNKIESEHTNIIAPQLTHSGKINSTHLTMQGKDVHTTPSSRIRSDELVARADDLKIEGDATAHNHLATQAYRIHLAPTSTTTTNSCTMHAHIYRQDGKLILNRPDSSEIIARQNLLCGPHSLIRQSGHSILDKPSLLLLQAGENIGIAGRILTPLPLHLLAGNHIAQHGFIEAKDIKGTARSLVNGRRPRDAWNSVFGYNLVQMPSNFIQDFYSSLPNTQTRGTIEAQNSITLDTERSLQNCSGTIKAPSISLSSNVIRNYDSSVLADETLQTQSLLMWNWWSWLQGYYTQHSSLCNANFLSFNKAYHFHDSSLLSTSMFTATLPTMLPRTDDIFSMQTLFYCTPLFQTALPIISSFPAIQTIQSQAHAAYTKLSPLARSYNLHNCAQYLPPANKETLFTGRRLLSFYRALTAPKEYRLRNFVPLMISGSNIARSLLPWGPLPEELTLSPENNTEENSSTETEPSHPLERLINIWSSYQDRPLQNTLQQSIFPAMHIGKDLLQPTINRTGIANIQLDLGVTGSNHDANIISNTLPGSHLYSVDDVGNHWMLLQGGHRQAHRGIYTGNLLQTYQRGQIRANTLTARGHTIDGTFNGANQSFIAQDCHLDHQNERFNHMSVHASRFTHTGDASGQSIYMNTSSFDNGNGSLTTPGGTSYFINVNNLIPGSLTAHNAILQNVRLDNDLIDLLQKDGLYQNTHFSHLSLSTPTPFIPQRNLTINNHIELVSPQAAIDHPINGTGTFILSSSATIPVNKSITLGQLGIHSKDKVMVKNADLNSTKGDTWVIGEKGIDTKKSTFDGDNTYIHAPHGVLNSQGSHYTARRYLERNSPTIRDRGAWIEKDGTRKWVPTTVQGGTGKTIYFTLPNGETTALQVGLVTKADTWDTQAAIIHSKASHIAEVRHWTDRPTSDHRTTTSTENLFDYQPTDNISWNSPWKLTQALAHNAKTTIGNFFFHQQVSQESQEIIPTYVTSTHGKTFLQKNAVTDLQGTQFSSHTGTQVQAHNNLHTQGVLSNNSTQRRTYLNKFNIPLPYSYSTQENETVLPVTETTTSPEASSSFIAIDGDATLTDFDATGPGTLVIGGNTITLDQTILQESAQACGINLSIDIHFFGKQALQAYLDNKNIFRSLAEEDPLARAIVQACESQNIAEAGVHALTICLQGVEKANSIVHGLLHNCLADELKQQYGLSYDSYMPQLRARLGFSCEQHQRQTTSDTAIQKDIVHLQARDTLNLAGPDVIARQFLSIKAPSFQVPTTFLHFNSSSHGLGIAGGTNGFAVDGYTASQQGSHAHVSYIHCGGHTHLDIQRGNFKGSSLHTQTASGTIDNLNVSLSQDNAQGYSTSGSLSSSLDISATYSSNESRSEPRQAGIFVENPDSDENNLIINNYTPPAAIISSEQRRGFGFNGNLQEIYHWSTTTPPPTATSSEQPARSQRIFSLPSITPDYRNYQAVHTPSQQPINTEKDTLHTDIIHDTRFAATVMIPLVHYQHLQTFAQECADLCEKIQDSYRAPPEHTTDPDNYVIFEDLEESTPEETKEELIDGLPVISQEQDELVVDSLSHEPNQYTEYGPEELQQLFISCLFAKKPVDEILANLGYIRGPEGGFYKIVERTCHALPNGAQASTTKTLPVVQSDELTNLQKLCDKLVTYNNKRTAFLEKLQTNYPRAYKAASVTMTTAKYAGMVGMALSPTTYGGVALTMAGGYITDTTVRYALDRIADTPERREALHTAYNDLSTAVSLFALSKKGPATARKLKNRLQRGKIKPYALGYLGEKPKNTPVPGKIKAKKTNTSSQKNSSGPAASQARSLPQVFAKNKKTNPAKLAEFEKASTKISEKNKKFAQKVYQYLSDEWKWQSADGKGIKGRIQINKKKYIQVRIMESSKTRDQPYMRVINYLDGVTLDKKLSNNRAETHLDLATTSLEDAIKLIKNAELLLDKKNR